MITGWTTEDGLRAIELMGWPEWIDDAGYHRRLARIETRPGGDYYIADPCPDYSRPCVCEGRHEALAILRDCAREYLAGLDIFVEIARDDGDIDKMRHQALRSGQSYTNRPITKWLDDYDQCLIAAVLAAGKDGEK